MKVIVDKLPNTYDECLFYAEIAKFKRCKIDGHLCKIARGEACEYLEPVENAVENLKSIGVIYVPKTSRKTKVTNTV